MQPDLAYPALRVAFEYEGDDHRERGRFRHDITRREDVEDVGWRLVRTTIDDLQPTPRAFLARAERALFRRRAA